MIYVAITTFVVMSFLAYIETLWMKAEIKREAKELRKLKEDFLTVRSKHERNHTGVDKSSEAAATDGR